MRFSLFHRFSAAVVVVLSLLPGICRAQESLSKPSSSNSRYGPLGLFDRRSVYGKGVFPEPFLVDDSDLEVNELRFDWLHTESRGVVGDSARAELEKGFGLATIELELPYERSSTRSFDRTLRRTTSDKQDGISSIAIGARHPIWQFVSRDEMIDNTLGAGFELAIPSNSPVSKQTEFVPKILDDLRIGDHFTLQTVVGYSILRGSMPEGGAEALEYGMTLGWSFQHQDLPLPGVEQLIPVAELLGETLTNHGQAGHNSLIGLAGVRVNLKAIGAFQPRLGVGYVFPVDQGGRESLRWGIYTSLVFDF